MKVYIKGNFCGYARGDEVEVYKIEQKANLIFLIWDKISHDWVWCAAVHFAPYPFWMQEEEGGK